MQQQPVRIAQIMGIMNNGGVEAVVMNYYRAIDRTRVQFDFFVDETSSFPQREEIERLGGRCFLVPSYARAISYVRALCRLFRENHYQIVHSQINTMGVFPLFAACLCRIPVRICHNHSTTFRGEGKKNVMKVLLRPFARLFATRYFACGDVAARWMFGSRLVDAGRVTVLPNAIDLSAFAFSAEGRSSVRSELGIQDGALLAGHVGRFMFQKNHAFLLHVFSEVLKIRPDAYLMLVGEGELYDQTVQLAKDLCIEQQVLFLGVRKDVSSLYSAMDVFCLPSYYEGLPVVMVESLSNGLTCVVSDHVTTELNAYRVRQLSLEDGAAAWAKVVCEMARDFATPDALFEQFDITKTAKRLEAYYLAESGVK